MSAPPAIKGIGATVAIAAAISQAVNDHSRSSVMLRSVPAG